MWARKLKQQHFEQPHEFGEFVSGMMWQFWCYSFHTVYCYVAENRTWDSTFCVYRMLDLSVSVTSNLKRASSHLNVNQGWIKKSLLRILQTPSSSFLFTSEHGLVNSGLRSSPIQCRCSVGVSSPLRLCFYQYWVALRYQDNQGKGLWWIPLFFPSPQHCKNGRSHSFLKVRFQNTMKASSNI